MSARNKRVTLNRSERMRDSEKRATSMALPMAVHRRLDLLAEAATDVAATRAEIVGMLIAQSEMNSDELERRVLAYRKMTVDDVLPGPADGSDVVVPLRKPGRPKRGAAS
jgi:hypothetical protein